MQPSIAHRQGQVLPYRKPDVSTAGAETILCRPHDLCGTPRNRTCHRHAQRYRHNDPPPDCEAILELYRAGDLISGSLPPEQAHELLDHVRARLCDRGEWSSQASRLSGRLHEGASIDGFGSTEPTLAEAKAAKAKGRPQAAFCGVGVTPTVCCARSRAGR